MTEQYMPTVSRLIDCTLEVDLDGTIVAVDDPIVSLLGVQPDELDGADIDQLVHPDDRANLHAALAVAREQPAARQRSLFLRCRTVDDDWLSCEAPIEAVDPWRNRVVIGLRGIGSHLEPGLLVDAVDALARRSGIAERYDSVLVVDEQGVITIVEDRIDCALGFDASDVVGHGVWEFVHPDDLDEALPGFARELADPDNREPSTVLRCRYADGEWRWFEATARNRLNQPSIRGVVIGLRDVGPPFGVERWNTLTAAEQEVVILVTRGASNQEIAQNRYTSVRTVEAQLNSVFTKLNLTSRSQVIRRAHTR